MKFIKSLAQFFLIAVGVVLAYAAGFVILNWQFLYETYHGRGEIAEKHDWYLLESNEWKHRDKIRTDNLPIIQKYAERNKSEVVAIGLPRADGSNGYVWIAGRPTSFPKIKLLPKDVAFKLTKDGFQRILSETKLDPEVEAFLRQHVSE